MHPNQERRLRIIERIGLTPIQFLILCQLYYGCYLPPDELTFWCVEEFEFAYKSFGCLNPFTKEDYDSALTECLAADWVTVLDDSILDQIRKEVKSHNLIGPLYGFAKPGTVEFTWIGSQLWLKYEELLDLEFGGPPTKYCTHPYSKLAYYFQSLEAAKDERERILLESSEFELFFCSDPIAIGPWRLQWWKRFESGYRLDVQIVRNFSGFGSPIGEGRPSHWFSERPDKSTVIPILSKYQLELNDLITLIAIENEFVPMLSSVVSPLQSVADLLFGIQISSEEAIGFLEASIRSKLLQIHTPESVNQVEKLLNEKEYYCPYHPNSLDLIKEGQIDFTVTGANLYRLICDEVFGQNWEERHGLLREYYREDHFYSDSQEGLIDSLKPPLDPMLPPESTTSERIVPIGPWCVSWWRKFGKGFRLERKVELGKQEDVDLPIIISE